MSALRCVATILIFFGVSAAWGLLGAGLEYRTSELQDSLAEEVDTLWGPAGLAQDAPYVIRGRDEAIPFSRDKFAPKDLAEPQASDVRVRFDHHNRYKGLLWFSTYTVDFAGTYTVGGRQGADGRDGKVELMFPLPERARFLEGLVVQVDGQDVEPAYAHGRSNLLAVALPDGAEHKVTVACATRGRDRWTYHPSLPNTDRAATLRNFTLTAATNFREIDYPKGTVSPVRPAEADGDGMQAKWHYDNVRMNQPMGIAMPARQNAGPIAARMSFFAPVGLLFFFTVLFAVIVLKKIPLHPMHLLFVSAGFFAFHILLSYLVDIINIHAAFWICAAVSVFLVVSYMRLVAGVKVGVLLVGLAQLVYLVGFSYAFFWRGRTGLTITVGAMATLFVLMQATARVKWSEVFGRRSAIVQLEPVTSPGPAPPVAPPTA